MNIPLLTLEELATPNKAYLGTLARIKRSSQGKYRSRATCRSIVVARFLHPTTFDRQLNPQTGGLSQAQRCPTREKEANRFNEILFFIEYSFKPFQYEMGHFIITPTLTFFSFIGTSFSRFIFQS